MRQGGKVVIHRLESDVLRDNPLGDPAERDLFVYVPPGYEEGKRYPVLLALTGFTGTGGSLFNVDPLGEDLKHRLDRLIASGACPPVIVAAPDCFTRLGGNQYINSTATGRYEDYLLGEILPFLKETYSAGRFGVFGKSSGGYGAMLLGMRHPGDFVAIADHSGDASFELCYIPELGEAMDRLREAGGPVRWLEAFWADENRHRRKHARPLNILAMAAHYSPNPSSPLGLDLPVDLDTGLFRKDVWERWRAWDPVNLVEEREGALRSLRLIYIDCGSRDEFSLHWGARALVAKMRQRGLHPHYEEFDDGHMSIAYRYDRSIPMLVKALAE